MHLYTFDFEYTSRETPLLRFSRDDASNAEIEMVETTEPATVAVYFDAMS